MDGQWMVAHVGPTAERQAAAGIPITRFGEDALGVWFHAKPGTIMRLESLPLGLAAGSRALHAISPGSMERVNISIQKQIERGRVRYIVISASIWFCWLVYSGLYFWAGYYFMDIKGYSLSRWSMVLLATLIMAMVGGVAGGWLMDRIGRTTALILGCVGLTLFVVWMEFASGVFLPIVAAI